MPSTFFGLTIAASGLNTSQVQINTTANNISNVNTEGYSKQQVNTVASSALRCYQKFGTTGTGVEAVSVTQCRDLYYDEKYWNNQSDLGFFEKKLYYMNQIESYYSQTSSNAAGFSTIYAKMFNAMSTLQTSPGDMTVRKEFISDAKELTEYFNSVASRLSDLQSSINDEIKTAVDEINAIAEKIAILNKQINIIEQGGPIANELRDQRALLVDELSEYVNVDVTETKVVNSNYPDMETGATYYSLTINGQTLVDNYTFETLTCVSRDKDEFYNQCDVGGLYDIVWAKDGNTFNPSSATGSLKAMFDVRDGNNNENLHATVYEAGSDYITVSNLSLTDVNELNMPSTGSIWVNSKQYSYKEFEFETNKDGEITSIKFKLSDDIKLSTSEAHELEKKNLQVGNAVDFMGIPYYMNQMSVFLRNFCEKFNDIERGGVTLNNEDMGSFFVANDVSSTDQHEMGDELVSYEYETEMVEVNGVQTEVVKLDKNGKPIKKKDADGNYIVEGKTFSSADETYYLLTARTVSIHKDSDKDASRFSSTTRENYSSGQDAADLIEELQKLQSKTTIFRGGGGDTFLQCIYADVTVDTQECKVFTSNYENIQKAIEEQRTSVSGVDQDEEALDLIKFQNAYNLASKCISVFTEIYDRLILSTGV